MKGRFEKGHVVSPEVRTKISVSLIGRKKAPFSEEHKRKLSVAQMGKKSHKWSAESREKMSLLMKGKPSNNLGKHHSDETKAKIASSNRGKKMSDEAKRKMAIAKLGKKQSPETISKRILRGENHHNWKGGITPINRTIRNSLEYKLWREAVFKRDNYTCIWCGQEGGVLNADHIKPFCDYPELRLALDNGRTLCVPCHKTTETFGGKLNRK